MAVEGKSNENEGVSQHQVKAAASAWRNANVNGKARRRHKQSA